MSDLRPAVEDVTAALATVDDPDLLTSVYRLVDANAVDYLQVTEQISYVAGSRYVDMHYAVENLADTPVPIRAAEAADIAAKGSDVGRSFLRLDSSDTPLNAVRVTARLVR